MAFNIPASFTSALRQAPVAKKGPGIMDMLNSPLGGAAVSAGAGLLQGVSANNQANKGLAQNNQQFRANMAQNQLENSQNDQRSRAVSAAELDPLGSTQNFAAKQALVSKLLGGMQNFHSTPGDPGVAAAMGSRTMPSLPKFSPEELDRFFGDATTQASIAQRQKSIGNVDPNHPIFDLDSLYGKSADGSQNAFMTDITNSNKAAGNAQTAESDRQRALIQSVLSEMSGKPAKKNKAGSALGGAASGAMTGASLGSIVPGIGTGIGAAVGGLGGLLKGLF